MMSMRSIAQRTAASALAACLMISAVGGSADAAAPEPTVGVAPSDPTAPATASATDTAAVDRPTPSSSDAAVMANLVNQHRRANGKQPLIFDQGFSNRTEPFAIALAAKFPPPVPPAGWAFSCPRVSTDNGFEHDNSKSIWASMPAGANNWGENLAYRCGSDSATNVEKAFDSLVRSSGHNANMLNAEFTHLAVSVVHYGHSTFVVQRFARVPGARPPATATPPTVRATSSCLAGKGRIDIDVTNPNATGLRYSVDVSGARGFATTRSLTVGANATGRVTITGRFDGGHNISVRPTDDSKAAPVTNSVTIDCASREVAPEVAVTNTCLRSNGRIDVNLANNTTSTQTYTVDVQSGAVRDRTVSLSPGAKRRITVTGRRDGKIPVYVRRGGAVIYANTLTISCDS